MPFFKSPEVEEFYDDRLIVSWLITQPNTLPPLKNISITISGDPKLVFNPNQSNMIEIPELKDNEIIINWVINKTKVKSSVTLSLRCQEIEETQRIDIQQ